MTSVEKQLDSILWCAEPWASAPVSVEARRELRACQHVCPPEPAANLQDLIDASNRFPVPFPVHTVRCATRRDGSCAPANMCLHLSASNSQELIDASNRFPVPFPLHTVQLVMVTVSGVVPKGSNSLEKLKASCPAERLLRNASSTYPLVHERVLLLMANFLIYKRKYGSSIEQALYRDMSVLQLIDRILQKRAVTFMKAQDQYMLLTGEKGTDGWESVGTADEKPPLVLSGVLSYDEMKLSALVSVSGYTECINDGTRRNAGVPRPDGVEREAVIIGVIGPRFKRVNRMEYEDIVVTDQQNTTRNGYGHGHGHGDGDGHGHGDGDGHGHGHGDVDERTEAKREWRCLWSEFYQIPSITHSELGNVSPCTGARVFTARWARVKAGAFDNTAYCRRMELLFDVAMVEAGARAKDAGKVAFLNIIGAGLGVWKMSPHQLDIFVLSLVHRARTLLAKGRLHHVAVINLAYIVPGKQVLALFKTSTRNSGSGDDDDDEEAPKVLFLNNDSHPRGGIKIQLQSRQPSAELRGEHRGMLLVLTYPWDGNAHPGNEFWLGKLSTSGDPAAACCTQVAELHNAHVNPAVGGANTRIAADTVRPLSEHCQMLATAS